MTDNIKYTISIDAQAAIKAINDLVSNTAKLNGATGNSDQAIQKMERELVKLSARLREITGANGAASKSTQEVAKSAEQAAQGLRSYRNASTSVDTAIKQGISIRNQELKQLRATIEAREELAKVQGGRNYNNASVISDSGIAQRQKDSQQFSAGLQARMMGQVATETENAAKAAREGEAAFAGLANTRYALYDVSRTLAVISAAALGVSIAIIKVGADFETMFAAVQRTSQTSRSEFGELREELIDISTQIPATVDDIAKVATIAGQLGVASGSIAEFTRTIMMFSAATGVGVEQASESIGRVAQLAKVSSAEYENLAASIYQVGITSVSTEDQILRTAENIAAIAEQSGFAAKDTVALSSALASIGIRAENARGSLQRSFNIIEAAVRGGGEELEKFNKIAGGIDFQAAWQEDSADAFYQLIEGLGAAADRGEDLNAVLAEVGIVGVRNTDVLRRLAGNTEVYALAIDEASTAYAEGTALADGYAITAETLGARLQTLKDTWRAIIDALNDDTVIKAIVDGLQRMASNALEVARSPLGKIFGALAVTLGLVAGGITGIVAAMALGLASIYAMVTATKFLTDQKFKESTAWGLARKVIDEYAVATGRATVAQTMAARGGTGVIATMRGVAVATGAASIAMRALKYAIVSTGIGIALIAIGEGIAWAMRQGRSESEKLESSFSNLSGLADAVKQDTMSAADAFSEFEINVKDVNKELDENEQAQLDAKNAADLINGTLDEQADAVKGAADEFGNLTLKIGEATRAWIAAEFFNDEDGPTDFRDDLTEFVKNYGGLQSDFEFQPFYDLIAEDTSGKKAEEYARNEISTLQTAMDKILGENTTENGLLVVDDATHAEIMQLEAEILLVENAIKRMNNDVIPAFNNMKTDLKVETVIDPNAIQEINELEEGFDDAIEKMGVLGALGGEIALNESLNQLGASLQENGNEFNTFTEAGRSNLKALEAVLSEVAAQTGEDTHAYDVAVASIAQAMVDTGQVSIEQLEALANAGVNFGNNLIAVANVTGVAVAELQRQKAALLDAGDAISLQGARYAGMAAQEAAKATPPLIDTTKYLKQIQSGWDDAADAAEKSGRKQGGAGKKAADGAKKTAKEIRTLSDYVSDLGKVMGDSFDFRFGYQQSVDDTAEAFRKIQQAMDDARDKARDLKIEMKELRATLKGLSAERDILEYQLTVAVEYGDTLRENEIRAELAENEADAAGIRADLKDTSKELAEAEEFLKASLEDNTEAGAKHRDMILDLIESYQKQIIEYANTGASQAEVEAYAKKLRAEFQKQAKQLGYNTEEVKTYSAAFDDAITIVKKMPRKITLSVNANPALRALDEYNAKLNKVRDNAKRGGFTPPLGLDTTAMAKGAGAMDLWIKMYGLQQKASGYAKSGSPIPSWITEEIGDLSRRIKSGSYRSGGYTGDIPENEVAGVVHGQEYVVDAPRVKKLGVPFLNALGRSTEGSAMSGVTNVSASMPSTLVVELGPRSLRAVENGGNLSVNLDGRELTKTVNRHNKLTGVRGG